MNYRHAILAKFSTRLNEIFSNEEVTVSEDEKGEHIQFNFGKGQNLSEGLLIKSLNQINEEVLFLFDLTSFNFYKLIEFNKNKTSFNISNYHSYGYIDIF